MKTTLPLRLAVLIAALLQPVTAYLSVFADSGRLTSDVGDPIITPAGYAFGIWSVITLGSVLYAIYQVLPNRRNPHLYDAIAPYVLLAFIGFSSWLYAADREWLWGTVAIFIVMGYGLYHALRRIVNANHKGKLSSTEQVVVHDTFGLYTGWTTVAIFANIAAALSYGGTLSASEAWWQLVVLIAATIVSIWGIYRMRGSIPYTFAILWAFVAVAIGTTEDVPVGILTWSALLGIAFILVAWVRAWRLR